MYHLKIKESCFIFIYIAVIYISGVILTEHLTVALQSCGDGNPLNVDEVPDEVVQPSNIKAVPCPPPNFTAQELAVRQVTLSWEQRSTWDQFQQIVILLNYSKRGDSKNTTVAKAIPAVFEEYFLKNLHPDSFYTFYAQAQYRRDGTKSSVLSSPAVVTLNTMYDSPSQPPVNLQCNASYSDGKRIVTLWWKPPEKKNWNGPLSTYRIHVSITAGNVHKSHNLTVNASLTTATFIDVDNSDNIEMSVQACNINNSKKTLNIAIGYLCSGIGGTCTVSGDIKSKTQPPSQTKKILLYSAVVVLFVFVVVIPWIHNGRNRTPEINTIPLSLPVIDDVGPYVTQYEEPESKKTTEEYTKLDA